MGLLDILATTPPPGSGGPSRQNAKAAAWGQAWGGSQAALSSGK